jgi:hypothetical protein
MTVLCLSEHAKSSIGDAYLAKKTQDELALIWGVSRRTIHRVLVEEGLIIPGKTKRSLTSDEEKILKTLKENNINHAELVKRLKAPTINPKNIVSTLGAIGSSQYDHIMAMVAGARQSTFEGSHATH